MFVVVEILDACVTAVLLSGAWCVWLLLWLAALLLEIAVGSAYLRWRDGPRWREMMRASEEE